jgi:transposase InsO family protein
VKAVQEIGAQQSMDGRGAWRDNVFVERLWRSVKYEEVYLHAYEISLGVLDARFDVPEPICTQKSMTLYVARMDVFTLYGRGQASRCLHGISPRQSSS